MGRHPRWLVLCTLVMALLLPLQGVALSLDAALRPAHVHRHAAGCVHGADVVLPSAGSVETVGDRSRIAAASTALADDTVLDYLPSHSDGHPHDPEARDPGDASIGMLVDASSASAHDGVGYHSHAPGDPDVVYVDDGRHGLDGTAGGVGKIASDGMVMLEPSWPKPLPARQSRLLLAAPLPAYATRHDVPPDRPPA